MDFDQLNKSSLEEKEKIKKELTSFAEEYKNPLDFKNFGLDENSEFIGSTKIKGEILKDLSGDDREYIRHALEAFQSFVSGPIFTDSFHEDASSREKWKGDHLSKLNEKVLKYYNSNRLRVNINSNVVYFLNEIEEIINDSKAKEELNNLKNKIPPEFLDKYENEDGQTILVYYKLPDNEKIRVVEKLTEITEDVISLLTEK
ncbi:MAG: hypothetical protein NT161_01700 [Candidatus Nomurabacteria bacterium]|nr:hypothetical protein [Candidatus Nomurabacteria bacterium]